MGISFTAILKYGGVNDDVIKAIQMLERSNRPPDLTKYKKESGAAFPNDRLLSWEYWGEGTSTFRPQLPNLDIQLRLPEGLSLIFGHDAIGLKSFMSLSAFMSIPEAQHSMLDVLKYLCDLFDVSECFTTSDHSNEWYYFTHEGKQYSELIPTVPDYEQGRVIHIADIYFPDPPPKIILKPQEQRLLELPLGEIIEWPRDEPQPDGWIDPMYWKKRTQYHLRLRFEVGDS